MYADRVEAAQNKSVMDRINGNSSSHTRRITGKRQRQDDKWEHDLYEETEPQLSNRRVGARDLRTKLQKKGLQSASQSQNVPLSGGRDLREKLSGTSTRAVNAAQIKPKVLPESAKQTIKSVAVEASVPDTKKTSNSSRRKTHQKESVDSFLQSLGLEKYLITFQAEEVDMAALLHMTDEDLKALGIPMGPRKKILLALESRQ